LRGKSFTAAAAIAVTLAMSSVLALDAPAQLQVTILGRALGYEATLKERVGDSLMLLVLYRSGEYDSEQCSKQIFEVFDGMKLTVQGMPLRAIRAAYAGEDALRRAIAKDGLDMLYVCDGLQDAAPELARLGSMQHLVTIGASEGLVREGLTLGVSMRGGRPKILVNATRAKEGAIRFESGLLRLAEMVD
jgi:hypothetical protein